MDEAKKRVIGDDKLCPPGENCRANMPDDAPAGGNDVPDDWQLQDKLGDKVLEAAKSKTELERAQTPLKTGVAKIDKGAVAAVKARGPAGR